MTNINTVVLVGRLTRDAELKYTNSGLAICKFSLALNRKKKEDDRWVDEVSFFDCVMIGKLGEALNQYLSKGKQVGVQGELRQDRWEQDGQNRSRVEVHVTNLQLLGSKGESSGYDSADPYQVPPTVGTRTSDGSEFEDDIPF